MRIFATIWLSICAAPPVARAEDLASQVREGHRAARESIRTLTATVTYETVHPTPGVIGKARYWRSGDVVRVQEGLEGAASDDFLMKAGEIRQVARTWKDSKLERVVAARRGGDGLFCRFDAWRGMMIGMTGPNSGLLDLDAFLAVTDGPIRADLDTLDGRSCVRLRFSMTGATGWKASTSQWHDIGQNYLIRRRVVDYAGSPAFRTIEQVVDFAEHHPGVVFPTGVRSEHYRGGKLHSVEQMILTDLVINKPIPATLLALPAVPHGTLLKDRLNGRQGPIDSGWKPMGPMTPLDPPVVKAMPPSDVTDAEPSATESKPFAVWLLSGSLVVTTAAVGLLVVRRLRATRPTAT